MGKLEEIRKRLEAATPWPWTVRHDQDIHEVISHLDNTNSESIATLYELKETAELIAHAPSDLRLLLRIVERQREALEYVQFVHIEKMMKPVAGADVAQWALEHNAQYARECIAEVEKMTGGGE